MEHKLTKQEMIEIELLISYYDSLILDEEPNKENPHAERDNLRGLIKLKNFYNKYKEVKK